MARLQGRTFPIETQESPIADTAYYKVDLDEERVFPEHHLIAETEYRFLTGLSMDDVAGSSNISNLAGRVFCTGFRDGNIPKPVKIEVIKDRTKTVKDWVDSLSDAWAMECMEYTMIEEGESYKEEGKKYHMPKDGEQK